MSAERHAKLASAMRDTLSQLVREVKDPRVRKLPLVSINHIDFNRDASIARIYVSFPGAEKRAADAAMQGLERATGFLRGPLGRAMRLKRVPRLDFYFDDGANVSAHLDEVVRDDQRRAEQAARDPGAPETESPTAEDAGK